jgi:hypothetical protein
MEQKTIVGGGLIMFMVLVLLTVVLAGSWIERDIDRRVSADLEAAGLDADITVNGRDVVLTSGAADDGAKARAVAGAVWGVRVVE